MEQGDPNSLEIIQTRDVTQGEARRMSQLAVRAIFQQARRDPLYWVFKVLGLAGLIVFGAGLLSFIRIAVCNACASFPTWSVIAAMMGGIAYCAMCYRLQRVSAVANHEMHRAGNRYRLTAGGLSILRQDFESHLSWRYMHALANDRSNFLMHIGFAQVAVLPKATFENQDVEGFCAELRRRWEQTRSASLAERAT